MIGELEDFLIRRINDGKELLRPNEYHLLVHSGNESSITYTLQYSLHVNTSANQRLVKNKVWDAIIDVMH